jgi:hypothetical protein
LLSQLPGIKKSRQRAGLLAPAAARVKLGGVRNHARLVLFQAMTCHAWKIMDRASGNAGLENCKA